MKTFYITFGQQYRRELHPRAIRDVYPHPDGWFEVRRASWDEANAAAMRAFNGEFAMVYGPDNWAPEWFPKGKLGDLA